MNRELDGFTDLTPVGSGGLGDVYRAVRTSTNADVAIKELRSEGGADAGVRRANRELAALASLRGHPNVVNLEEVLPTDDGKLLLVMEYSPLGSIAERAERAGSMLPLAEVVLVGQHAAHALETAHELGIVHRDIKPQNLLIGAFGQVKVCDFGIASIVDSDDFGTKTDSLSYRFASPEELRGERDITAAVDVYSLGVSLAKLLTNRYYNHESAHHLRDRAATPGRSDDPADDTDVALRGLLVQCMSPDPATRPSARALVNAFDQLALQLGDRRLQRLTTDPPAVAGTAVGTDSPVASGGVALPAGPARPTPLPPTRAGRPRRRLHPLWYVAILLWTTVVVLAVVYLVTSGDPSTGAPPVEFVPLAIE